MAEKAKCRAESSRDCVSEEVSGVLSVPNKPSGFCGRKAVFTYLQVSSVLRVCVRARMLVGVFLLYCTKTRTRTVRFQLPTLGAICWFMF